MRGKAFAHTEIEIAFVSVQPRFAQDVFVHDLADGFTIGHGNMERAHVAAALYQRNDCTLIRWAPTTALSEGAATGGHGAALMLRHVAKICFVRFNDFASATKRL